jgi:predicted transcriptional regulator of viral defense system
MVLSTKELMLKYQAYKSPKMKIKAQIEKGVYHRITKGWYETDPHTPGHLLCSFLVSPSYLSFEYAMSYHGLIPERVTAYTCATTLKSHTKEYINGFGRFRFQDVPVDVFAYGVERKSEGPYAYLVATPEKALCDWLSKLAPVASIKELRDLLFLNLRIDEAAFQALNKENLLFLSDRYPKQNLRFLRRYLERA